MLKFEFYFMFSSKTKSGIGGESEGSEDERSSRRYKKHSGSKSGAHQRKFYQKQGTPGSGGGTGNAGGKHRSAGSLRMVSIL